MSGKNYPTSFSLHKKLSVLLTCVVAGLLGLQVTMVDMVAVADNAENKWLVDDAPVLADETGEVAEGHLRERYAYVDADAMVSTVVSDEVFFEASPGERVIVPKNNDIELVLFDEQSVAITVDEVALSLEPEKYGGTPNIEVLGTYSDGAGVASLVLMADDEGHYSLSGGLDGEGQAKVELTPSDEGIVQLAEFDDEFFVDEGDDVLYPPDIEESAPPADADPASGVYIVNVLVGYVQSMNHQEIEADILKRMAETNSALATSQINMRVNLVGMVPVNYSQTLSLSEDIVNLRNGTGDLGVLHTRRDEVGADLVSLIVPESIFSCGAAWVGSSKGISKDRAFSIVAAPCLPNYTLTHELGHNFGAGHDTEANPDGHGAFSYSRGYKISGVARSVMSYDCSIHCQRRLQFSNPSVNFLQLSGISSGTEIENNARSINETAALTAAINSPKNIFRVAGADRYSTAAAISASQFTDPTKVNTVVISTGVNFSDALSAAPIATKYVAPLLLTDTANLPSATINEIARLNPSNIVIVGGTSSVSASVEESLKKLLPSGSSVRRLQGTDRYETSLVVAKDAWGTTSSVFVASGRNFPDALSAGAAAGKLLVPIILVNGTATSVSASVKSYLNSAGVKKIYIAGGSSSVSSGVENSLQAGRSSVRYGGANRYETSAAIANAHYTKGGQLYLAGGTTFPDALTGAVVAGMNDAPLVLTQSNCVLESANNLWGKIGPSKVYLLGGPVTLSESVKNRVPCT